MGCAEHLEGGVAASIGAVDLGVDGQSGLTLAGVPIELSGDDGVRTASLTLYPAVYPLDAVDSELFDVHDAELDVTADPAQNASVVVLATKELHDIVQAQVDAYLDDCAAQPVRRAGGDALIWGATEAEYGAVGVGDRRLPVRGGDPA